jgi:hypothetical protein
VQRHLCAELTEIDARQPRAVADRPGAGGVLVDDVVSQQQLRESLSGAHQIAADRLPGADDIAQRLLLAARDPDRVQAVDHQQPQHPLTIALIGFHPIRARPLDLPRRRDHAPDPGRVQRPRQAIARRPCLIRHPRRTRQQRTELDHLARLPRQPARAQLARLTIDRHSKHRARVHVQTHPTANLRHMVGSSMRLWAPSRGATRTAQITPHASRRGPTMTTSQAGRQPPYGLRTR